MQSETHLTARYYETKCRRCGKLHDWYFGSGAITHKNFITAMEDRIASPRMMDCSKCEKETIQDLVSYNTTTQ